MERFSKRSREIRGRMAEVAERINRERARLGLEPVTAVSAEALDLAARQTRAAKLQHLATSELRAGWRKEAEAAGPDPDRLVRALRRVRGAPPLRPDPGLHRRVAAWLTEHASTFGERDVAQALADDDRAGFVSIPHSRCGMLDAAVRGLDRGPTVLTPTLSPTGELLRAARARSGSGGWHAYPRLPENRRVPSSAGRPGPGLDIRAEGGTIVAPPSRHAGGGRYRWLRPGLEPPPAPAWPLELAAPPQPATSSPPALAGARAGGYVVAAVRGEAEAVARAPVGTRNQCLNLAAFRLGRLVAAGLADEVAVREVLLAAADAAGLPRRGSMRPRQVLPRSRPRRAGGHPSRFPASPCSPSPCRLARLVRRAAGLRAARPPSGGVVKAHPGRTASMGGLGQPSRRPTVSAGLPPWSPGRKLRPARAASPPSSSHRRGS